MTDITTHKPLRVSTDGPSPYIRMSFDQLDDVRLLFDSRNIAYQVEELAVSINGGPETVIIDLGRGGDAAAVQAVLDSGN